jgi:hypothetical protein
VDGVALIAVLSDACSGVMPIAEYVVLIVWSLARDGFLSLMIFWALL